MPQMMPINWVVFFFLFITIFILFNMLNYYIKLNNMNFNKKYNFPKLKNFNWKW